MEYTVQQFCSLVVGPAQSGKWRQFVKIIQIRHVAFIRQDLEQKINHNERHGSQDGHKDKQKGHIGRNALQQHPNREKRAQRTNASSHQLGQPK